ncbi:MAG: proline reductase-associated electron transfer protein PrdC [Clostridium sp.]|nr:proline reductase-associated electron transfer protein PrdC [Clostridium sp.]MCI1717163.1 proline reductase-associated electron transfer protein PrdC [Clostridium sp.]MCI1801503.1 proline reductase-associated electron transfer protein PrdC [Clostridium sp.]MCI1815366.1 proline reductase-associated electron transfer protein PrdC [Clostridium sp.]MCI1872269.1 proline reductase-associated electron transfer protein PrdC [Clostridium sp.]
MERYRFLMNQHIGKPSVPLVEKDETVKRGRLIAGKMPGVMGSNIYSSVDGRVVCANDTYIEIEEQEKTDMDQYEKLYGTAPQELVEESGLVGLGGAGFPTYVKLSKPLDKDGTLIINAAECEPILTHNILMIEKKSKEIVRGIEIVMGMVHAQRAIIGIKEKNKRAVKALEKCVDNYKIKVCLLRDMYPMGEERAIIRETKGILLDVDELPSKANTVVINVETVYRIYEAVDKKKPFIDKDVTVAGKLKGDLIQVFEDVPIGTKVSSLIEKAGGCYPDYGEIIMGGPFTGKRTSLNSPVIKTTGGIIVTETFLKAPDKIGLLVCACGADEKRLVQIAESMGSEVTGIEYCKQARKVKSSYKCENPGICPGQVQKVMALKKTGAKAVLISNCSDCTNTVMSCAPKIKLPVYHCTDGALRAVNHRLIRKLNSDNKY